MDYLELPLLTSTVFILVTFLVVLVVSYLILVRWVSLSKITWNKIDYIWLSLALLGIVGAVESNRQNIAANMATMAKPVVEFCANDVERRIASGQSTAVCRKFVRSEFSPPPDVFDRNQKEYDEQCAWFNNASERLRKTPFSERGSFISKILEHHSPPVVSYGLFHL